MHYDPPFVSGRYEVKSRSIERTRPERVKVVALRVAELYRDYYFDTTEAHWEEEMVVELRPGQDPAHIPRDRPRAPRPKIPKPRSRRENEPRCSRAGNRTIPLDGDHTQ
jgi:hypothetical protein